MCRGYLYTSTMWCMLSDFVSTCGALPLIVSAGWYFDMCSYFIYFSVAFSSIIESVEIARNTALITGCLEVALICTCLFYLQTIKQHCGTSSFTKMLLIKNLLYKELQRFYGRSKKWPVFFTGKEN